MRELTALRTSVALAEPTSSYFRIAGDDAFEVVDRLVTSDLYLQEAQLRQTLILDDDGLVAADAIVGRDEDAYVLMLDGIDRRAATELLSTHLAGTGSKLEALHESHDVLGIHGPYAWELIGEWLSPDLVGMPYLSLFRSSGALVLRAGRTGEYGYDVLVPRPRAAEVRAALDKRGQVFDLGAVDEAGLDLAALENGFFNVRREGRLVRDPLELQLKWRLGKEKSYRGSEAVLARWKQGPTRRVTWLSSADPLSVGDVIELEGEPIGEIVNAAHSPIREVHLGIAILNLALAHAGVTAFGRIHEGARAPIRTLAPPVMNNLSMHVSPQRHSYRDRASFVFPTP